jgi:hypothetical protein
MNPYARFLGDLDPVRVASETPAELGRLLDLIGPSGVNVPREPGKWSAREIVCHLADCEIAFGFRMRQTISQENHLIQPFDQEAWAKFYACYEAGSALAAFCALRAWNLTFIRSVMPGAAAHPVTHPERGAMTFRTLVETLGGHDMNHRLQLEAIAGKATKA